MALTKIPPSGINIAALTNELGGGTTVYSTIAALPLSNNTSGSMAFVSENNRLYIWNGTGWFNIALINTSPTITSGPSASYVLATNGTPVVITLTATDPEGIPVTWSYQVTSGTLGNTATITQNSNVFTITPSTSSVDAGTFGVTFTASDGVNLATATSSFVLTFGIPIGSAYGGGFYAGQISTSANGVATHHLVVGPLSTAQNASVSWKNATTATPGSDSVIDGPQNTADMVADGSSTVYPAAHFCDNLTVGGFSDWYMPAKNELEVCYYNLKPTTTSNTTGSGANTYAVPSRSSNYTAGTPAQTSAATFQTGGAEAFAADFYWSSTEFNATGAWIDFFSYGGQFDFSKNSSARVRAVRRIPV